MESKSPLVIAIEIFIRLVLLGILLAWCFQLLYPFASIILWGIILALVLAPVFNALSNWLNKSRKWPATIIIVVGLLILILPSWWLLDSTVDGAKDFRENLNEGTLTIPTPPDKVMNWPLVGEKTYNLWQEASVNLESFTTKHQDQIKKLSKSLVDHVLGIGTSILQFALSIIIAGILLATKGTKDAAMKIFRRLVGSGGKKIADLVATTVGNVTRGILGVALIQTILVGIGFLLAGVPYAGVWALLVFLLATLQIPPPIIVLPVCIYLFSSLETLPAILWSIYLMLAGISDNVFKPILLGIGAPVPMLVIFLGVIGGFMLSGFIGLFTGAIVLSLGYRLFINWLNQGKETGSEVKDAT